MKISDLRQDRMPFSYMRILIAIVCGENSYAKLEQAVLKASLPEIEAFCNKRMEEEGNNFDELKSCIDFFFETEPLDCNGKSKSITTFINENNKEFTITKSTIYDRCLHYIRVNDPNMYVEILLNTTYGKEMTINLIKKMCREMFNGQIITSDKEYAIYRDFKTFFHRSSMIKPSDSCSPWGWIESSFNFYRQSGGNNINRIINAKSQDAIIGQDKDSTLLEITGISTDVKKTIDINFVEVTSKIAKASALFYMRKKQSRSLESKYDSREEVFYDIYTKFVSGKANRLIASMRDSSKNGLSTDVKKLFKIENRFEDLQANISHVNNKKKARDAIANVMEKIIYNNISVSEVYDLYRDALTRNDNLIRGNDGLAKDGTRLFDSRTTQTNSKMTNGEKFEILYEGYVALKDLITYLDSIGFPLYAFDTTIFRNMAYPRRFQSLQQYLDTKDTVFRLISDADRKRIDSQSELLTNDESFDLICIGEESPSWVKYLQSYNISDIKVAYDTINKVNDSRRYISDARKLYEKVFSLIDYFTVSVFRSDDKYVGAIALITNADSVAANKMERCGLKRLNYQLYHGKENYLYTKDNTAIDEHTDEWIDRYIADYGYIFNFHTGLLRAGAFVDKTDETLDMYVTITFMMLKYMSDYQIKFSIYHFRLFFFTMNLLDELLRRAGHPIAVDGMYVLDKEKLSDELECLGQWKSKVFQVSINFFASKLMMSSWSDWDKLYGLFTFSSVMSQLWSKIAWVLGDIANLNPEIISKGVYSKYERQIYLKYRNDGEYAALLRAGKHLNVLLLKEVSGMDDIVKIDWLKIMGVHVKNQHFRNNSCEQAASAAINFTVRSFVDVFRFFEKLQKHVQQRIPLSIADSKVLNTLNDNQEVLENASREMFSIDIKTDTRNPQFLLRFQTKIKNQCKLDSLGYVTHYGQRYKKQLNGNLWYLHIAGFWIEVVGSHFIKHEVTKQDYSGLRGVLID